jgi:septal ring factor EnvC (AmiA/AmiB activator)
MRPAINTFTTNNRTGEIIASAKITLPPEESAPFRFPTPQPERQEPLKLDEMRSMLETETATLAIMDEELAAMKTRQKEITYKIAAISRETQAAQNAVKHVASEFARGHATDADITAAQNTLMLSQAKAPAYQDVLVEINSELVKLQATRDDQAATVSRYSDSCWSAIESIELSIAEPYIHRAYCAALQRKYVNNNLLQAFGSRVNSIAGAARAYASNHTSDLVSEYSLPSRS